MIELIGVSKKYGSIAAVDNVSFRLGKGNIVGLLGANGAGKSTLLSMICTLQKPNQGDIRYQGQSILKNPALLRKDLGYVPQEIGLYQELTGRENLMFWGRANRVTGSQLKTRVTEIVELIGLEEQVDRRVGAYSGGMQRRLNIGVALIHKPAFLVMDEPTVGIDPLTRRKLLDLMIRINQTHQVTVLFSSHYTAEVEYIADQIIVMDHGKIVVSDKKENLLKESSLEDMLLRFQINDESHYN